jgi:hypothetical protein
VLLLAISAAAAGPLEDGVEALKQGRAPEAVVLLSEAVEGDPSLVEGWWELGWARWVTGDLKGAADAWTRVEALDPKHPDLEQWLGAARTRAALAGVEASAAGVDTVATGPSIRFMAGGDTMMGSDLRKGAAGLPPSDGNQLFDGVRELLSGADVAFLNLEGPLADGLPSSKCGPDSSSCYAFRTPTRFAEVLKGAGVDVLSLANNHASDLGAEGQQSTMDALDAVGLAHGGRYGDVGTVVSGGLKVALVAAHSGACCLSVNDLDEVRAAVALADRDHDLVVFAFHGGAEGAKARHVPGKVEVAWGEKRGDVKALSHAAVDAGADLVIGTGPHVLRAMEVYRGRLIAYSLGNFMGYRQFGTAGGYGGRTVLVEAELASNGVLRSAKLHALALDGDSVPHVDPTRAALDDVRELTAADFPDTGVRVADDGTLSWATVEGEAP